VEVKLPKGPIPVRVLLAANDPARRRYLAESLQDRGSFDLAGEARSTREALKLIRSRTPDVVVVETDPPRLDGFELLRCAASDGLRIRLLLISSALDGSDAYEALRLGACGLISSEDGAGAMRRAIAAIARGGTVIGPHQQIAIAEEIRTQPPATTPRLTKRERAVLSLAASGATTADIADRLGLSENTVKTYCFRIYRKLGVTGKTAAVARAIREGMLQLGIAYLVWQSDFLAAASQTLDSVT
jgi:DNA-binding NarL/FixJ family response regulator